MGWIRRHRARWQPPRSREAPSGDALAPGDEAVGPAAVAGRDAHDVLAWVDELDRLRLTGDDDAEERLLLTCIAAVEAEAAAWEAGVPATFYARLARLYRRGGDRDAEQAILVWYAAQQPVDTPLAHRLHARLERLR